MIAEMTPVVLTLKRLREQAGLTQAQLAESVGVRQATISDLENGHSRRIELDLVERLADALGEALGRDLEPGELLERETPKRRRSR